MPVRTEGFTQNWILFDSICFLSLFMMGNFAWFIKKSVVVKSFNAFNISNCRDIFKSCLHENDVLHYKNNWEYPTAKKFWNKSQKP